ncbi:MAG: MBL fold metallo-hydrolase [Solobacterium sp.]|nr:MBL fold metallo-hydrolase [Solobacterium sp.]
MKLTMLGTGHAGVTNCYNTCFLLEEEGKCFLTDTGGGNGLIRQLRACGHSPQEISEVFITHKHLDHITGFFWLERLIHSSKRRGSDWSLTVYSHEEVIEILRHGMRDLLLNEGEEPEDFIRFEVVRDGDVRTVLGHETVFFDIHAQKARQFGFRMKYNETDTLTCLGDEPYNDSEQAYVEGCTWLMHESFCKYADKEIFHPRRAGHSTVKDAAETAERLGVKNLLIYHTEDRDLLHRRESYTAEALQYFHGHVYVPDDLDTIEL